MRSQPRTTTSPRLRSCLGSANEPCGQSSKNTISELGLRGSIPRRLSGPRVENVARELREPEKSHRRSVLVRASWEKVTEKMKLYDYPQCPFGQKVRIVLAEKELSYELANVDLRR